MKFVIALVALIAAVSAAPTTSVAGKIQVSGNTVGDIVTIAGKVHARIDADINQEIVNVIVGILSNQVDLNTAMAKLESLKENPKYAPYIEAVTQKLLQKQ